MSGKARCKADLQQALGLQVDAAPPLLVMVSRLAAQKGLDVALSALPSLLEGSDLQVVLLGSGDVWLESGFHDLAQRFPQRLAVRIGFDEQLAHRIVAAGDLFLMPSRYEPCGLSQLYSLRYGTVPVVHATGGLDDTVSEFDAASGSGTGFKFAPCTPETLRDAVSRAITVRRDATPWTRLQERGMREDFSWERSAGAYRNLYAELLAAPS